MVVTRHQTGKLPRNVSDTGEEQLADFIDKETLDEGSDDSDSGSVWNPRKQLD
jgi:hypothetical protein